MRELSVFIDESGDFGAVDNASPYYLVSMLFHNQDNEISDKVAKLDSSLRECNICDNKIHSGPIIRKEPPYQYHSIDQRRQILFKMRSFLLNCDLQQHTFVVNKKEEDNKFKLSARLAKDISWFIKDKMEWLNLYDKIIVYYDNGQMELNLVINTVMNTLCSNVELRHIKPEQYRLSQAVDYVCTMELLIHFFYKQQELKKTFLKPIINMRI